MKHSYEASRIVLATQPILTSTARAQNFLALPASGRTLTQLHEDYRGIIASQKISSPNSFKLPYASYYATHYVIGWARYRPDQAIEWARQHINHFETNTKVQTQFLSTWLKFDTKTANQWFQKHPEQQALVDDQNNLPMIPLSVLLGNQPAHQVESITLPR